MPHKGTYVASKNWQQFEQHQDEDFIFLRQKQPWYLDGIEQKKQIWCLIDRIIPNWIR